MDRLYFPAAGCLLREYDSFSAITYSWLGIGRIQEVIINVSQWEVFALTEGVVEHNVSCATNNHCEGVPNVRGRALSCTSPFGNFNETLSGCHFSDDVDSTAPGSHRAGTPSRRHRHI